MIFMRSTFLFSPITALVASTLVTVSTADARSKTDDVETVPSVDLQRYLGQWYEIASIPQSFQKQCVGQVTAEYSQAEDSLIKVVNSCEEQSGERSVSEGRAKVEDIATNAKLKVTFVKIIDWIFKFGGDYWIIDLAPDYHYAVVGHPTRDYGWVLSRTPSLPQSELVTIEAGLRRQGYDSCRLLTTVQTGGFTERKPLCDIVKASSRAR